MKTATDAQLDHAVNLFISRTDETGGSDFAKAVGERQEIVLRLGYELNTAFYVAVMQVSGVNQHPLA